MDVLLATDTLLKVPPPAITIGEWRRLIRSWVISPAHNDFSFLAALSGRCGSQIAGPMPDSYRRQSPQSSRVRSKGLKDVGY